MRWPWVSRLAYETVCAERDRLMAQNDTFVAHLTRMDRVDRGLSETARIPRAALVPMSPELRGYIDAFASPAIRKAMRDQAYRRHASGQSWETIFAAVKEEEDQDE